MSKFLENFRIEVLTLNHSGASLQQIADELHFTRKELVTLIREYKKRRSL